MMVLLAAFVWGMVLGHVLTDMWHERRERSVPRVRVPVCSSSSLPAGSDVFVIKDGKCVEKWVIEKRVGGAGE